MSKLHAMTKNVTYAKNIEKNHAKNMEKKYGQIIHTRVSISFPRIEHK